MFFGPFCVMEIVGAVAYKLELPAERLIHPVFHISHLQPFTPNYNQVFKELPKLIDMGTLQLQPEGILDRRLVKKGSPVVLYVLVKWEHVFVVAATWEDLYIFKARFSNAVAWGQATSAIKGGVTTSATKEVRMRAGVFDV